MLSKICFVIAAVLFLFEGLHIVTKPMVVWGLFALAIGFVFGGWDLPWPWKKTAA